MSTEQYMSSSAEQDYSIRSPNYSNLDGEQSENEQHQEADALPALAITTTENTHYDSNNELASSRLGQGLIPPYRISLPPKPVDLRSLEYVESYDHNLMCAICHCPFVQPVRLDCDHVFCRNCISQALVHQEYDARCCPTCRRKTNQISIVPAPKIINRILDELVVRCPSHDKGCTGKILRGSVQDHVDHYCDFVELECPLDGCPLTVQRKDARNNKCLHSIIACGYCTLSYTEQHIESHRNLHCSIRRAVCPSCKADLPQCHLQTHLESCPEALLPCTAAAYGCDFTSKRKALDQHTSTCPLAKLGPFLQLQNDRLATHETALNHLRHKNSLLQTSYFALQEALHPPSSLLEPNPSISAHQSEDGSPFDSVAHHLLSLLQSLREEVGRVSAAVSDLDAKASMMVMNESLRTKEEIAHMNAVLAGMRMHIQWLMSVRLQGQQRAAMVRSEEADPSGSSSSDLREEQGQPARRLSDSARQDTKL